MGISSNNRLRRKLTRAEVSKVLRLPEKELKEFEREGLFDYSDQSKTWVDEVNFNRIKVAVELKREFGVNIPGIDVILAMRDKMTKMKGEMNQFLTEVRERLGDQVFETTEKISKKTKKLKPKKG